MAIVSEGSFQKAAEKLGYAPSTVTFQVQQLEEELSVQLFDRLGRRMVLSEAGKDILPIVSRMLDDAEELRAYSQKGSLSGELRIDAAETLLTYKMQPVLKKFSELAPDVRISISMLSSCQAIRNRIARGETDLGFLYDKGELDAEPMGEYPFALVASSLLASGDSDFITEGSSKPFPMIEGDKNSVFQRIADEYLDKKRIRIRRMSISSIEAIKQCVAGNIGIAVLPLFAVEDYIEDGMVMKLEGLEGSVSAYCAYHKGRWVSPAMELFIQLSSTMIGKKARQAGL